MNTKQLQEFLIEREFIKVKLHFISSNHYKISAQINGTKGWFIVDTGASTTFLSEDSIEKFKVKLDKASLKAHGAGPEQIEAQISNRNTLKIGRWLDSHCSLALIDLNPINSAFNNAGLKKVDGIIGADILKKGNAVIDYGKNYIYLK